MRRSLRNRFRAFTTILGLTALSLLVGCPCPECLECEKCPGGIHPVLDVPVPGPIIDTTGSGGTLTHRYDEVAVTGSSGDTNQIDNRFITEVSGALLVNTGTSSVYGLAKNDVVKVTFNDGSWYTVKIGDSTTDVEWVCSSAGGSANVTLVAGSAGALPDCVRSSASKTVTSIQKSTGESGSILVLQTLN